MKKAVKMLSVVFQALLLLLALALLVPRVLGFEQYAVLSGSMAPALPVGSMIVVKSTEIGAVEAGDIVSFTTKDTGDVVTHRVVGVEDGQLITRGDANNMDDAGAVSADRLLGKVLFHLPLLGYFSLFVNRAGPLALILGAAALYLLVGVLPGLLVKEKPVPEEAPKQV